MREAVREQAWSDKEGLFLEGPGRTFDGLSQHSQALAILCGAATTEQTRRILEIQRRKHMEDDVFENMEIEAIKQKHWSFQRLLLPVGVKNRFGERLTYGDDRLQGRRDHPKYLALIKATAFLRQMQKEISYESRNGQKLPFIEVDPVDIRIANSLAHEILGRSLDESTAHRAESSLNSRASYVL